MTTIVDDLADLFSETVIAYPGYLDGYGDWIASGAALTIPCRIEGNVVVVNQRSSGRDIGSHTQIITRGYFNLSPVDYRYDLPAHFRLGTRLRAIEVETEADETGPIYETVYLP